MTQSSEKKALGPTKIHLNLDDRYYRAVTAASFPAHKLRYRNDAAAESMDCVTKMKLSGCLILAGSCHLLAVLRHRWHFAIMVINSANIIPTLAMAAGFYLLNFMMMLAD